MMDMPWPINCGPTGWLNAHAVFNVTFSNATTACAGGMPMAEGATQCDLRGCYSGLEFFVMTTALLLPEPSSSSTSSSAALASNGSTVPNATTSNASNGTSTNTTTSPGDVSLNYTTTLGPLRYNDSTGVAVALLNGSSAVIVAAPTSNVSFTPLSISATFISDAVGSGLSLQLTGSLQVVGISGMGNITANWSLPYWDGQPFRASFPANFTGVSALQFILASQSNDSGALAISEFSINRC
jgi:hypothetical protein